MRPVMTTLPFALRLVARRNSVAEFLDHCGGSKSMRQLKDTFPVHLVGR
jgi:hypothetical protein